MRLWGKLAVRTVARERGGLTALLCAARPDHLIAADGETARERDQGESGNETELHDDPFRWVVSGFTDGAAAWFTPPAIIWMHGLRSGKSDRSTRCIERTRALNYLLRSLSDNNRALIERHLEPVALERGVVLIDSGQAMDRVYFPESGIVSLVSVFSDGTTAEITTIGREGFVGVGSLLDDDLAIARQIVQVPGHARVMPAELLREVCEQSRSLRRLMGRYAQALIAQISQSVACNGIHGVEERMARWLLMTHDRSDGDELLLTQEFLALMLGVRRPTVTVVARTFQSAGLIRYRRGRITIVDRPGLEEASCECHSIISRHFQRLLSDAVPPSAA